MENSNLPQAEIIELLPGENTNHTEARPAVEEVDSGATTIQITNNSGAPAVAEVAGEGEGRKFCGSRIPDINAKCLRTTVEVVVAIVILYILLRSLISGPAEAEKSLAFTEKLLSVFVPTSEILGLFNKIRQNSSSAQVTPAGLIKKNGYGEGEGPRSGTEPNLQ